MSWQTACRGLLAAGLLAIGSTLGAAGLQVAPIGLNFSPAGSSQGLWLTNTGHEELQAQVRVFRWTQENGQDNLVPSRALVVSPPMLSLEPGQRQLVRVIRTHEAAKQSTETAYRLWVDELPQSEQAEQTGVRYVLRYSVPVFMAATEDSVDVADVAAALQWSLLHEGDTWLLQVHNSGITHAQISEVTVMTENNETQVITPGLLGYVLPGMTMRWPVTVSESVVDSHTHIKARINGKLLDQAYPVDKLSH